MLNLSTAIKVHKILNTTCVESARGIETGELIGFLSKGILAESCTGDDWHGLE